MLCPFLLTILFIETSSLFIVKTHSLLSKTISTIASFEGEATLLPKKRRFWAFAALKDLILNLPRTKHKASDMLLFPDPLGPRITLIPSVKGNSVFLGKLLKPCITSLFTWNMKTSCGFSIQQPSASFHCLRMIQVENLVIYIQPSSRIFSLPLMDSDRKP